jgi:tetratricopeptide (TPR) repeat protein
MQLNKKHISDLDYLAELGFNACAVNEADITELKLKVKTQSFSFKSGNYFYFVSLIVGVFIGISVFFTIYNTPHIYSSKTNKYDNNITNFKAIADTSIILDTINVINENFVKAPLIKKKFIDTLINGTGNINQTNEVSTIPIVTLPKNEIKEAQIKYIANSSLFYLHDLKITNYSTLYFKLNKFISLNTSNGLSAAYANEEDYKKDDNLLETFKPYYLHQAIADAMLQFKNKNYKVCLNLLKSILEINENDINCKFYSGMCFYYNNNFNEAIKCFEFCTVNLNNTFLQESEYYTAKCYLELGNREEANKLFKKIASEEGFYSERVKYIEGL